MSVSGVTLGCVVWR